MADFNQSPADSSADNAITAISFTLPTTGAEGTFVPQPAALFTAETSISAEIRIGSPVQRLDDLTDVIITNPVNLQRLIYDGSYWRNSTPA